MTQNKTWEFPGSPLVLELHTSTAVGTGSWLGNNIQHAAWHGPNKNKTSSNNNDRTKQSKTAILSSKKEMVIGQHITVDCHTGQNILHNESKRKIILVMEELSNDVSQLNCWWEPFREVLTCMISCVWLFVTPWIVAHQAPLSTGFSRGEFWSWLPFPSPGDLPDLGIEPVSPVSPV